MKMRSIKQFAKIILNSDDATLTQTLKQTTSRGVTYTVDETDTTTVVDLTNETIRIDDHNLSTGTSILYEVPSGGTVIGGLTDNTIYYVIRANSYAIKLATTYNNSQNGTAVNLTTAGTGNEHKFTVMNGNVNVVTNYNFKLTNINPSSFNSKTRMAVQSFYWSPIPHSEYINKIGNVYIKNIPQTDVYSSQGIYKGVQLVAGTFSRDRLIFENQDIYHNYIKLPMNKDFLQNGIDIFVDTKKQDDSGNDIGGCPATDSWQLALILYDIEDEEYLYQDMSQKQRNYMNIALS